jgi:hypothetical protein
MNYRNVRNLSQKYQLRVTLTLRDLAESLYASSFRASGKRISYLAVSRLKDNFLWMIVWGLNPERVLLYWRMNFEIARVANPDPEVRCYRTVQCCIVYATLPLDLTTESRFATKSRKDPSPYFTILQYLPYNLVKERKTTQIGRFVPSKLRSGHQVNFIANSEAWKTRRSCFLDAPTFLKE